MESAPSERVNTLYKLTEEGILSSVHHTIEQGEQFHSNQKYCVAALDAAQRQSSLRQASMKS